MPLIELGRKRQIKFDSYNDFFESLGFLSKNDGTTSVHWEHNEDQGAWGSEGRIHCYKNLSRFPSYFRNAFTIGTGNIKKRINCNEYVRRISVNHNFVLGRVQNIALIRATIPNQYQNDFDRGLNL